MKGMANYLMISAVVVAIYSFVVMAEVYRFQSQDEPSGVNCYDHLTSHGVAASKIACADICGNNALCRGFVYEPVTMNCTEIRIANYPDRRCQAGNRIFYAKEVPACNSQYLVSGPKGVINSQLSESSTHCDAFGRTNEVCQPAEMKYESAWYARLGNRGHSTGGWVSAYQDVNQYVQVDFLKPTTVSSVVLTGRDPDYHVNYVTSFKFLYSDDCSLFKEIAYENGISKTLQGNSDGHGEVTRQLPERVQARCFRINPTTWFDRPALRFDLKGCH